MIEVFVEFAVAWFLLSLLVGLLVGKAIKAGQE